jgi:hypothetical protein
MAADYPPFLNAYGNITKILHKIKEAQTPGPLHDRLPLNQIRFQRW